MKKITLIVTLIILSIVAITAIIIHDKEITPEAKLYLKANNYFQGSGDVSQNTKRAMEIWTKLAENGNVPSQCIVGYVYKKGYSSWEQEKQDQTIEGDNDKALYWLTKAAKGKCPFAMYQLGLIYKNAEGNAENTKQAIHWLTPLAAKAGYDYAQYNLGMVYLNHDPEQAKNWFLRAAKQGHKDAIKELSTLMPSFKPPKQSEIVYENELSKHPRDAFDMSPSVAVLYIATMFDDF